MGKPTGKKKTHTSRQRSDANVKGTNSSNSRGAEKTSKEFDEDMVIFINMSQELKEEGNKSFQIRDYEGAMLKYEKALKLLPGNHIDVAYLRSNMAACCMQIGIGDYPRAITECNLALAVAPKYSKALLKRARCYAALNRLEFALRDVNNVLGMEPNNLTALEIAESVKKGIEEKGLNVEDKEIFLATEYVEPPYTSPTNEVVKEKTRRKKSKKFDGKKSVDLRKSEVAQEKKSEDILGMKREDALEKASEETDEKITEDKVVMKEKRSVKEEKLAMRAVKVVLGEDIRIARLPIGCSMQLVRDVVQDRFPNLKGVLIKYKDQEGDLITITTNDELRLAEESADPQGFLRLYIVEVSREREPVYEGIHNEYEFFRSCSTSSSRPGSATNNLNTEKGKELETRSSSVTDWIIQFARLFKDHIGIDCDSYLDLHEIGMKLYSEAMEDTITSEDAQKVFNIAAEKFQEMVALALFNWGNIHMTKARKRVSSQEDASPEGLLAQVKVSYDWAQQEYLKAGSRYEEAIKQKPDFYEGFLALGQQNFELAKLSWYYVTGSKKDLESAPSAEILDLYNKAEDSMERGMQIWEEMEEQSLNGLSKYEQYKADLKKFGLELLFKDVTADESDEQANNMRSQIYRLWGTMLYERSVVEFKLNLTTWEECLEVSIEKFELAGASPMDIAVMIKNHCSNETAMDGFKVDEIVRAWNEMYDTNRWLTGGPSFRLQPLFLREAPRLLSMLEHL
ncbi:hypothetical protein LIER_28570 [Lithospermum erythrorhizon]|uniref:PB1 domain-containing protein n=1 Tax=Lithospermum erythrorhizon TaxID=34254 RepID=A0AAV3RG64_LITER